MRYFKRRWDEARGDEYGSWGLSTWYLEVGDDDYPVRQVEQYDGGPILTYDKSHPHDEFGALSDQVIDLDEFKPFEIDRAAFEIAWSPPCHGITASCNRKIQPANSQFSLSHCAGQTDDKAYQHHDADTDCDLCAGGEIVSSDLFDLRIGNCCSNSGLIIDDRKRLVTNFAEVALDVLSCLAV